MKNSLKWTAAFLAACMLLSVGAMAEDVADETTEPTAEAETTETAAETTDEAEAPAYTPAYVTIDGKEKSHRDKLRLRPPSRRVPRLHFRFHRREQHDRRF